MLTFFSHGRPSDTQVLAKKKPRRIDPFTSKLSNGVGHRKRSLDDHSWYRIVAKAATPQDNLVKIQALAKGMNQMILGATMMMVMPALTIFTTVIIDSLPQAFKPPIPSMEVDSVMEAKL
jgi:hypothetical protein